MVAIKRGWIPGKLYNQMIKYRTKIYWTGGVFFILITAIMLLLVCPLLKSIAQESKQLENRKAELIAAKTLSSGLKDFKKNYQFYQNGLSQINDMLKQESLVDPEMPVQFINFIKKQAQELGISLKIIPLGAEEEKSKFWNYLNFRIEGTGRFNSLMQFTEKIEYGRWFIDIEQLSLSKQGISDQRSQKIPGSDSLRQINLLIKVYAQKQNQ